MNLPLNGKVVVVDDNINEALPLISVLSKQGVPVHYFDGEYDNLPENPIHGARIIFLDIELNTGGQDNKSKAAKVINVITKLVGPSPNPYVIIAWTKHPEVVELIEKGLSEAKPILILTIEKYQCKDDEGNFELEKIKEVIEAKLDNFGCFHLFISWENSATHSASNTVNNAFSFFPLDDEWDNKMQNVIYNLAKAYSGKQLAEDFVLSSLMTFNSVFLDTLERNIQKNIQDFTKVGTLKFEDKSRLDASIMAKINSTILLSPVDDISVVPGNIYFSSNIIIDSKDIFGAKYEGTHQNVLIEVSPTCDYAQQKWRLSRVLPGLLCTNSEVSKIIKTDYIIKTPLLNINNGEYHFVFDLRLLDTMEFAELEKLTLVSRLRHMLLVDIQSCVAKHVSRPGYLSLV